MKSIPKPTFLNVSETRIESTSSVQHWLLSLFLHFVLISVFVFLTIHSKNQKTPTRTVEAAYVVYIEKESQKKNPKASSAQGREERAHHDKATEIISANQPSVGDKTSQSKPKKILGGVTPNAESHKFKIKKSEESKKRPAARSNLSSPVPDQVSDAKKIVELNTERLQVNDSYTEFLTRIERRIGKFDPKLMTVKSGFSGVLGKLPQDNGRKNSSISDAKGPASSCSVEALEWRATLSDKMPPGHYYMPGSNPTVRISDLVGHGRYVQTARPVRVSDLLGIGAQLQKERHPNVSVTVSDLLRQYGPGFQSFCQ